MTPPPSPVPAPGEHIDCSEPTAAPLLDETLCLLAVRVLPYGLCTAGSDAVRAAAVRCKRMKALEARCGRGDADACVELRPPPPPPREPPRVLSCSNDFDCPPPLLCIAASCLAPG
jgi:hypothetical protein